MTTLFTLGYQGHAIDSFIASLHANGIEHVIDVRERPFSRKPDFNKKRLAAHLADAGIAYTHLGALGTPKPLRDDVRRTHDYAAFFEAMDTIIASQPEALQQALAIARAQPSALLCYEGDAQTCHRTSVAGALFQIDPALNVVDL
ncbi:MAG TPA: DUF488 domain-containing protein [Roseiflexaceae bacterium]|nr:DUF488 domain-containing protein [Roseiflexaceae bacterium]